MITELLEKFEDIFKPPNDEEAKEREKRWLERKFDKSLLIDNGDGTFDYDGDLDLFSLGLTSLSDLPYKLRRVKGNFDCSRNQLTTLEEAPEKVGGNFYCYNNKLTTLEGAPEKVGRGFSCYNNQLTTLEGAPREVGGYFGCRDNSISEEKLKKTVDRDYLK